MDAMNALRMAGLSALIALAGCAGVNGPNLPDLPGGGGGGSTRQVVIPNQVSGGDRSGQALPGSTEALARAADLTPEEREQRVAEADALWQRANATPDAGDAADLYQDLADDYPESPNAAEAMFRYGRARYQAGDNLEAIQALVNYMSSIPVNPHLGEVEEMLYTAAARRLNGSTGLARIFASDDIPLDTFDFVAQTFPAGSYADDALLRMAEHYQKKEEWPLAVLHYKELLIRYPDSEWSFRARIGLADSYIQRDQGDPYNAGFVDLDPRETYANEQAETFGANVKSSLRMALEQYEAFLSRIEVDPGRQAEYAEQVRYAQRMRLQIRNSLAAKDLHVARWYRGRGDRQAARTYLQYAAAYADTQSGRTAAAELRALGGTVGTVGTPPPSTPRITPPSRRTAPRGPATPAQPTQPTQPIPPAGSGGRTPPLPPPPAWPPTGGR